MISLDHLQREDAHHAGTKAANLGELLRAGFPVPAGVVVPPGVDGEAIGSIQSMLGEGPWAVRSSGVAEDLAEASFAGQYVTVLGVQGTEGLHNAVRRCRESAARTNVVHYQNARANNSSGAAMPVLVQRMIRADAAGVAFTANPLTGARDEVIVSAVLGLGERLVSGESDPDEWVVRADGVECRRAPEDALDEAQVRRVADLARQIELHFGQPQDVEWAIEGDTLWVLQARPITALPESIAPVPVAVNPPPGFWEKDGSHFPRPASPMFRSFFLAAMTSGLRELFSQHGVPAETLEFTEIGGWQYQRLVPLGGKDPPPLPRWLTGVALAVLVRLDPRMRERNARAEASLRQDGLNGLIDRWNAGQRSGFERRAAELRSVCVQQLDIDALRAHLDATVAFQEEALSAHVGLDGSAMYPFWRLWRTCHDLAGWDEARTLELLCGYSATSTEPARRLAELARLARQKPAVLAALDDPKNAATRLEELDPEFDAAFGGYMAEYGCRALRYEVADPTVAEVPELVLGLIRDQVQRDYDPLAEAAQQREIRQRARVAIEQALAGKPARARAEFEDRLRRAERAYGVKEENVFRTINVPLALVRLAVLEVGQRLVNRGQIAARDDVFMLELDEARAALSNGADQKARVRRREGERRWVEAHPGPPSYGRSPGPPPPMWGLPRATAEVMEVVTWSFARTFDATGSARKQAHGSSCLTGTAASSGSYTGRVRVVMHEGEFSKIRGGDVLVCPITSPVWSVLFPSVGAVVTNTGGILAHSAIIAREYGIPAVVGVGNATEVLRDGQLVRVDGTRGVVEVVS
jgi:pyruvate,water dikinase